jgi:hypothetical protein
MPSEFDTRNHCLYFPMLAFPLPWVRLTPLMGCLTDRIRPTVRHIVNDAFARYPPPGFLRGSLDRVVRL